MISRLFTIKNNICATEYHSISCIANPAPLQLSITLINVPEKVYFLSVGNYMNSFFSAILSINRILAYNQRPFVLSWNELSVESLE